MRLPSYTTDCNWMWLDRIQLDIYVYPYRCLQIRVYFSLFPLTQSIWVCQKFTCINYAIEQIVHDFGQSVGGQFSMQSTNEHSFGWIQFLRCRNHIIWIGDYPWNDLDLFRIDFFVQFSLVISSTMPVSTHLFCFDAFRRNFVVIISSIGLITILYGTCVQ